MTSTQTYNGVINPNYVRTGNWGNADFDGSTANAKLVKRAKLDGNTREEQRQNLSKTIAALLGNTSITPVHSRNLDIMSSYPRATTGIPYAIQVQMCSPTR